MWCNYWLKEVNRICHPELVEGSCRSSTGYTYSVCYINANSYTMSKIIKILLLYFSVGLFQAQTFVANQVATYSLTYKTGNLLDQEQFVLLINTKNNSSYFLSTYNFVKDTLQTGDMMKLASMESDFNERVLRQGNTYTVYENIKGVKLRYAQTPDLRWNVMSSIKMYNGYKLQKAEITAYGRDWEAWFSTDIQSQTGPYKFYGLPGLIFLLKSKDGVFDFQLQNFKQKKKIHMLPKVSVYKEVSLKDINKTRFKIQTSDDGVVQFNTAEERKKWMDGLERRYINVPLLDSYYPKK